MKRTIAFVTALILLAATFMFTTTALADYYAVYSCCSNGKPLNVRSGPGKEYPVIDKIPYGQAIYVLGYVGDGWLQLNDIGYVLGSCTSRTQPGPYVPPTPGGGGSSSGSDASGLQSAIMAEFQAARYVTPYAVTTYHKRSSGEINMRWAPSKKATLIHSYSPGETLMVLAELKDWSQVQDPETGWVGFIRNDFLKK